MRYVRLYNDSLREQSGLQAPSDLKACLVLGARLRPDNTLTPILQLRVRLVSILARTCPQWVFYISGCRADTSVIYRTLVNQYHIPEERLMIDSCGYNTFRSIRNMKAYYGLKRFYILTSSFHIVRALRVARWLALCYINGHATLDCLKDYYRRMHYLNGIVSFATRNHYFTWIMQSAISEGFVERIGPDEPAFPFTGLVDIRPSYMTTNRHLFRDLGLADDETFRAIKQREQQGVRFTYIPRELLGMPQQSELGVIRDGDLLAVVCDQHSWARGLDIKHILMAKWQQGRLFFYHVGDGKKGLSPVDAFTYMKDKFTMIGVAVYRLKDNQSKI